MAARWVQTAVFSMDGAWAQEVALAVRAAADPVAADDCLDPLVEARFPQQAA